MIELLIKFLTNFVPLFFLMGAIFFMMYILYIFVRCIRRQEKLSEALTIKEKQYFYLAITYIFTYIFL